MLTGPGVYQAERRPCGERIKVRKLGCVQSDRYLSARYVPAADQELDPWVIQFLRLNWVFARRFPWKMVFRSGRPQVWASLGGQEPQSGVLWRCSLGDFLLVRREARVIWVVGEILRSLWLPAQSEAWSDRAICVNLIDHVSAGRRKAVSAIAALPHSDGAGLPESAFFLPEPDLESILSYAKTCRRSHGHVALVSALAIFDTPDRPVVNVGRRDLVVIRYVRFGDDRAVGEYCSEHQSRWVGLLSPSAQMRLAWSLASAACTDVGESARKVRSELRHFADRAGKLLPIGGFYSHPPRLRSARRPCLVIEQQGFVGYSCRSALFLLTGRHVSYAHNPCGGVSIRLAYADVSLIGDPVYVERKCILMNGGRWVNICGKQVGVGLKDRRRGLRGGSLPWRCRRGYGRRVMM